ncbi:11639_t:CDS:2 [Diversispora eburnea]|uniref:11639_t:CDS:1 n=1 Tax=Diversispora eburnea TaxID=1213867 RepID=A0A9N9CC71_9GLOM|nr:11639_t:CDS:2 [Diversispora eburnea]
MDVDGVKSKNAMEHFVNYNPDKFSTFFKFPNRLAKHLHGRATLAIVRAVPKHYLDLPTLKNIKIQRCFKFSSRWSDRETNLLNNLVAHFGPYWFSVAANLPGRILNMEDSRLLPILLLDVYPNRLTATELKKLFILAREHDSNWFKIAENLPGGTPSYADCLESYHSHKYLFAHVSYQRELISWSEAEEKLLKDLIGNYNEDFDRIAKFFPGRGYTSIRTYYSQHQEEFGLKDCSLDEIEKKAPWTGIEENKLINLVRLYHEEWKQISNYLPNRSPEACKRKHYTILHQEVPSSELFLKII